MSRKLLITIISLVITGINGIEINEIQGLEDPEVITALTNFQRLTYILEKDQRRASRLYRQKKRCENTITAYLQKPFVYPVLSFALYYARDCRDGSQRKVNQAKEKIQNLCQRELELTKEETNRLLERIERQSQEPNTLADLIR